MIGRLASAAASMAGTIRDYLPFSPATEGPLSGLGNPEQSGMKIAEMVSEGITQNVNLPSRAMERALAPVAPGGRTLERSEEHTSALQSLIRIPYAVLGLKT